GGAGWRVRGEDHARGAAGRRGGTCLATAGAHRADPTGGLRGVEPGAGIRVRVARGRRPATGLDGAPGTDRGRRGGVRGVEPGWARVDPRGRAVRLAGLRHPRLRRADESRWDRVVPRAGRTAELVRDRVDPR